MSTKDKVAVAKPRRRWFQFSLGSLLLVMTVFGIWLGIRMDRARRQEQAVAALRERGEVQYDSVFVNMSKQPFEVVLDATLQDTGLDWILTPDGILITTDKKAATKLAAVRELKRRLPNLKKVVCVVAP